MDSSNVPIGSIQKILGHEHRTTTEIYLHGVRGDVAAAMAEFESAGERLAHQLAHRDARQDTCAV
jgi:integrase